jgi:2-C-methyl-D-erythritol 2,4-cyclodiphosphate synthase
VTDAILGAAGMGDIGALFPDTDPQFKDADSRVLLRTAVARAKDAGWRVGNVDATVIAERPKIGPFVPAMCACIAAECGIDSSAVNVKGKTSEKLGYAGRGEGIAAHAVALLFGD